MSKKVLVISSSLWKNSNSEALAWAFAKGAEEAGNEVEFVSLQGKELQFCIGCLSCQKTQQCVLKDAAPAIVAKMKESQVLAFASPIYYYSISGQLKTLLDRANPLFPADYQFRDIYFLSAAAEEDPATPQGAETAIQGWVDCFAKAQLRGTVFAGGVTLPGEVEDQPALAEAEELGRNV